MADGSLPPKKILTTAEVLTERGISRREFMGFCSIMAMMMGLGPTGSASIAEAMEKKPRIPVLWLHGSECTCCTESFIRSGHPQTSDIILSMISLDYDDTLMAAAGEQAESIVDEVIKEHKGQYILAVEGNAPLANKGWNCIVGGRTFQSRLLETAKDAKAILAWGTCASYGCVQAAKPNPTKATPVSKMVSGVPIINVPGCPPIPEVMTAILTYILTFDRLPELDSQLRPKMFYGQRIHDKCYRRPHFDAGQYVESWDDDGARQGHCLYKMGCRGPTTYNSCSSIGWNDGISFPIKSGHGCIGCSEDGFWDKGPFYERLPHVSGFGIEAAANKIGATAAVAAAVGVAAHGVAATVHQAMHKKDHADSSTDTKTDDEK